MHDGKLYLHNSGTGYFGYVDLKTGKFEPIAFCPGYLRPCLRWPLRNPRPLQTRMNCFTGLPLQDALSAGIEAWCGLQIIDLKSGDVAHWARIQGIVTELYDVITLPGVTRPMATGFQTDEIQRTFAVDAAGQL